MCTSSPKMPPPPKQTPPPPPPPPAPDAPPKPPVVNEQDASNKGERRANRFGTRSLRIDLSVGGTSGGVGLNVPGA